MDQSRPLAGQRVLVTRPQEQAADLIERLRDLGAEPVPCATIRVEGPADYGPLDEAIAVVDRYDWVIFTSVNGVRFFGERLAALGCEPARLNAVRLAAIGPATARTLAGLGLRVEFVPGRYVAEAIVEEIGDVAGQRILLPRADIARKALAEGLRDKGAQVDEVTAYRTVAADASLPAGKIDIATFTSPSTVRNFVALVEAAGQDPAAYLAPARVACIGPITAQAAEAEGIRVDVVAEEHTVEGLIAAIAVDGFAGMD